MLETPFVFRWMFAWACADLVIKVMLAANEKNVKFNVPLGLKSFSLKPVG
tara:strand:+ start:175 stop:324 length:150 start_codon:yes stop_codon:yes gene_type:complete